MRKNGIVSWVRRRVLHSSPYFATNDVQIGRNVSFGSNVRFFGERVRIGNGTIIGDNVRVDAVDFSIGNYGLIYDDCFFPGGNVSIGHNFWLGHGAIIDGNAGATIGNGVGIGAQSQLWTHIGFGDTLVGCRFDGKRPLRIGDDVWFVGHCLVSPITAEDRSMAMLGSVVTKDMGADRVYAGSPAVDMTEQFGPQFVERRVEERVTELAERLERLPLGASARSQILVVTNESEREFRDQGRLLLNVESRTYNDIDHPLEYQVLWGLLPTAKFVPKAPD